MDYLIDEDKPNKMTRREFLELIKYIEKYFLKDDKDKIAKKMLNDKQRWYLWNGGLTNDVLGDWR